MHADDSKRRAAARSLCAQLHDDDRPPPRRERRRDNTDDRKTLQLCAQVRRVLEAHIPTHPGLTDLRVERVEPAPDATRLRAVVSLDARSPLPPGEALALLSAAAGRLRAEIARAITRKRVPGLAFILEPRSRTP